MAKNVTPNQKGKRLGEWKPFFVLLKDGKLPWFWLAMILVWSLIGAQVSLLIPDATAKVMAGDISLGAITRMIAFMFLSTLLGTVSKLIYSVTTSKISLNFRKYMLKKTVSLPVPFYDKNMADRLITRTTQDTTTLSDFITMIPDIPATIYRFVGVFIILFGYNWRLVAREASMIPIILGVSYLSGRVQFTWWNRIQGKVADFGGYLSEILANVPLVKVFVKENTEEEKGDTKINGIFKTKVRYSYLYCAVTFFASAESIIQTIIVVLGGAYLVRGGHITLEQWIAFYMYSSGLVGSFSAIVQIYENVKRTQGTSRRMAEIAMEPSEDRGGSTAVPQSPCALAFEDVTFRYDEAAVLNHVSFTIPAGKTTALVGPSGAGKSTIFGLLERFYVPESGKVTLNGKDAHDYDLTGWRRAIGYVPQSSPMFSGTIRYNMTYGLGRPVSDEELIRAAKDANIYEFIQSLPDGFDTQVGERGSKLSGGQRQRVAIARALLKDPQILLLDEATSSLDPEAAHEVKKAMERLQEGRTTVIVAHEIKSIENADQIVVLDCGTISGIGSDEQLMGNNELYRSLKNLQSGAAVLGKA